jgi:hypothetical protein
MMNEKDNDSIATVQMKPEYAPSEVYSTASEPPPAYKMRNSNSVKIAKIVGCTVICSALIIGLCILGSTYLQAKASCNYMDSVQAALEKELLLDRFDDYPRAEALHESESNNLLNAINKKSVTNDITENDIDTDKFKSDSVDTTSTTTESTSVDKTDEVKRVQVKLPLELELDHIANAILEQNQKAKMNCIVERRRAEEIVDAPGRTLQLPFGLNINTDPKQKKVTGERLVIMCESGMEHNNNENNNVNENDDVEEIRQIVVPINAIPLQFGPRGPQYPLTHLPMHQMPQQQQQQQQPQQFQMFLPQPQTEMRPPPFMMPQRSQESEEPRFQPQQNPMFRQMPPQPLPQLQQFHFQPRQPMIQIEAQQQQQQQQEQSEPQQQFRHQMPPQFQFIRQLPPQPQQPPVPATMMQAPRPEMPEIRIQLHRIQIPIGSSSEESVEQSPPQPPTQRPTIQIQRQLPQQPQPQQQQLQQQIQQQLQQQIQQQFQRQEQGREMQHVQVQEVPLSVALQRAGITPDDLRNIQRIAEAKIHEELRQFVSDDDSSDSDSDSSTDDSDKSEESATQQSSQESESSELERQLLPIGRMISFGRSLINPVRIPVPMMPFMQNAEEPQSQAESDESERPHFVHPRSVDESVKEKIE